MKNRFELIQHLRDRIVGELHVGHLRAGDRLPSIRDVALQLEKNPRTVATAYRALEKEGLVEVRGRAGVFVARQEVLGDGTSEELARWLSGVVAEAWKRGITVAALSRFVRRCTVSTRLRCGLVEVVEDAIVALGYELENDWGIDVRVVAPEAFARRPEDFDDVDFFAATSFNAAPIHGEVERLGKPLVVLTVHPQLQAAIRGRLRDGRLAVVAVDARFEDRIRVAYAAEPSDVDKVHFVLASDHGAVAQLDPDEPVLLTRAASMRSGVTRLRKIFPHSPTLSPETARALANIVVRRNLGADAD
ncbi:MAG: GntR family transcriptional regulator [Gemmatimonadota bacterium]